MDVTEELTQNNQTLVECYKRETCRTCLSSNLTKVVDIPCTPIGDNFVKEQKSEQASYPLDLYLCDSCGLLQLLDVVNPELIYRNYLYQTSVSLGLNQHFKDYVDNIIQKWGVTIDSLMLDIGCNDGTLLYALKCAGMRVLGVEPAQKIAEANNVNGIPTIPEFFCETLAKNIIKEHGHAKLVFANNVMANIDNLDDFVSAINTVLDTDGLFILETGYAVDFISNLVLDNVYHEHYSYFRINPLKTLFERNGMQIIDVEDVNTKGGSIRVTVQKKQAKRHVQASVQEKLMHEVNHKMNILAPYNEFSDTMKKNRDDLLSYLKLAKAEGKKIAGYGASVGVVTLLYYFGVHKYLDLLLDDNEIKQGLFSPGEHLKVYPSEELYQSNIDIVVVFPWRYADIIMDKHQKFINNDGAFVVPMPEFRIINNKK